MTVNFTYIDLPPIPESLYLDIYNSLKFNTSYSRFTHYKIVKAKKNIYNYIYSIFDPTLYVYDTVNVQKFTADSGNHIDRGRSLVYNFIIDQGNPNVKTNFFKNYNDILPMESHIIEPFKWHSLKVDEIHGVSGIKFGENRISVSVFKSGKH